MEYESFMALVKKRRSSWEFKPDPIPEDMIEKIVEAARYSPSGFNSQPWEFVVIKEPGLRKKIIEIFADHLPSQGVKPGLKDPMGFKTAPVFIILYGDTRVRPFAPPPVKQNDKRWSNVLVSSLAISYQYMHLAAASLGLATRWVSAVNMPPIETKIRALLGIPEQFMTYDMMALGTSDFKPSVKKMRPLSEVTHYGQCHQGDFRTDEAVETHFKKN
jgi:nitroreductase